MKILLLDNYDSFTYMLRDYIEQCGATCDIERNDANLNELDKEQFDAFVISPGPGRPAQSGNLMSFLESVILIRPVLGICLGHQAIGELFGAKLVKAEKPVHGKTCMIRTRPDALFNHIAPSFEAARYHSLILEEVPDPLESIATTDHGEVMAIRHVRLPVRGIQFHPESCRTAPGIDIIKNFLSLANDKS